MLKPFDKVLVRSSNLGMRSFWMPALYGCKRKDNRFITSAGYQDECIPYEGNEKLLGTQFDYIEKKEKKPSFDEAQGTPIIKNGGLTDFEQAVGVAIGSWHAVSEEDKTRVREVANKLLKLARKQIESEK